MHERKATYDLYKARVLSWLEDKESKIAKLKAPWKALRRKELEHAKVRLFGPTLQMAEEEKPLRFWMERAANSRRSMSEAIATGNYRRALLSESCAEYAEFQVKNSPHSVQKLVKLDDARQRTYLIGSAIEPPI